MPQTQNKRIEYLDAIRGFTMILVVMNHVAANYLGITYNPSNLYYYFSQIEMPLFFFVSGFVLYKKDFVWNIKNSLKFLNKKLFVQIISPFIFFCTYVYLKDFSFVDRITDRGKAGFWFTFTLFTYFIIYAIIQYILGKVKIQKAKYIIPIYLIIGIFFFFNGATLILTKLNVPESITGTLGTANLIYFIYFLSGTLVRKYFTEFEILLDKSYTLLLCIIIYFSLNIFVDFTSIPKILDKILNIILSIAGTVIVFNLFRKNELIFKKDGILQKSLRFVGQRTLDIYFIHFFFIYKCGQGFFSNNDYPLLDIFISLTITVLVIAASLAVSYILRQSPILAHYLLGAKKQ